MICRIWHGWTIPEKADDYEWLLRSEIFNGIAERAIRGYRGIELVPCSNAMMIVRRTTTYVKAGDVSQPMDDGPGISLGDRNPERWRKTMSVLAIPRPAADEAASFYHGYIAEVTGENIADQLRDQLQEAEHLFSPISDKAALSRYAPGKWSVKEVLGHLIDAERIFAYRLLRISRADPTALPGFDENAYVPAGRFDERPLRSLVEEFRAVRQSSILLVEGTPAECWPLRGEASGKPITARAIAYILVGHVAHHLDVLRERYQLG